MTKDTLTPYQRKLLQDWKEHEVANVAIAIYLDYTDGMAGAINVMKKFGQKESYTADEFEKAAQTIMDAE